MPPFYEQPIAEPIHDDISLLLSSPVVSLIIAEHRYNEAQKALKRLEMIVFKPFIRLDLI
jgi:hypothetical protein